ncbi:hypothetical protein K438DRAFT_1767354 [Mycena galopus ATCC 62051]|nr:hypothetical protein K438DRAFT_1767354 [Mycena galopus ATCC 62051]
MGMDGAGDGPRGDLAARTSPHPQFVWWRKPPPLAQQELRPDRAPRRTRTRCCAAGSAHGPLAGRVRSASKDAAAAEEEEEGGPMRARRRLGKGIWKSNDNPSTNVTFARTFLTRVTIHRLTGWAYVVPSVRMTQYSALIQGPQAIPSLVHIVFGPALPTTCEPIVNISPGHTLFLKRTSQPSQLRRGYLAARVFKRTD